MTEKKAPPAVAEFALNERDELLAEIARYETTSDNCELFREKIEAQAREMLRLRAEFTAALDDEAERNHALRMKLAALKAQSGAVVILAEIAERYAEQIGDYALCTPPTELVMEALIEVARLNPSRGVPEGWTLAADQKPQTGKAVLAHYTNSHGMGRRIRAEYIAAWTVQVDDLSDPDTECVEYSEQDDAYYLTAGWYELVDNWDEHGRISVNEGVITHWMPLPAAPTPAPVEPAHSDVLHNVPRELLLRIAMPATLTDKNNALSELRALLNGGQV